MTQVDLSESTHAVNLICRASPEASVERMAINGCAAITDSGLRSVSVTCAGLRKLELRGCQRVTNAGLDEVFESCPALLHVDASGMKAGVLGSVYDAVPCWVWFLVLPKCLQRCKIFLLEIPLNSPGREQKREWCNV